MNLQQGLILLSLLFLGACSNAGTGVEGASIVPSSPMATSEPSPTSSPSPAQTFLQPGDYNKTITIGSDLRSYILHVPTNYDGTKALPLIYILHGGGGQAKGMEHLTDMSAKADHGNFFVAYLQATADSTGKTLWNSGILPQTDITADDVAFVRNLTQDLETQLKVDSKRIYAAGFSNGGFMAHRLGTDLSDILAGVAVVEGTIGLSSDGGASYKTIPAAQGPISALIIHGVQDHTIPYFGGQGVNPLIYAEPVSDAVEFWTTADTCTALPTIQLSPDNNVSSFDYAGCENGTEVELYTIANGEHEWPTLMGHTGFSATDAILQFFARHSK